MAEMYADLISSLDEIHSQLNDFTRKDDQAPLYGFRDRYEQAKEKAGDMFGSIRKSFSEFFRKLTDATAGTLPEWVYTASEGALQTMLTHIEERYADEDEHTRKVAIEMLRKGIDALRKRIIEASKKAIEGGEKKGTEQVEPEEKPDENNNGIEAKNNVDQPASRKRS